MRRRSIPLVLLLPLLAPEIVEARCSSSADVLRFESAVRRALRCEEQRLFHGDAPPCPAPAVPACAAAEHAAILDLVYGAAPPGLFSPALPSARCQIGLTRAAVAYLHRRVPDRLFGRRRAPRSRLLRKVSERCEGVSAFAVPGGRLPAVAERCAPLAQSGVIDAGDLGRCLSARLEDLIDAALPDPLRPNVLIVLTDDQRTDSLSVMPTVLSEIAARGVTFSRAFTSTSACSPSRASILTGLYAHNHGIVDNASVLIGGHAFDHEDHVAGWLRSAGYRTALFGKYLNNVYSLGPYKPQAWTEWQVFTRDGDNYRGYELNLNGQIVQVGQEESQYSTDRMASQTLRFVRENAERPFFVVYSPYAPPSSARSGGPPCRPLLRTGTGPTAEFPAC